MNNKHLISYILANVSLQLRSRIKCQVRQVNESGVDEVQFEYLVSDVFLSISFEVEIKNITYFKGRNFREWKNSRNFWKKLSRISRIS